MDTKNKECWIGSIQFRSISAAAEWCDTDRRTVWKWLSRGVAVDGIECGRGECPYPPVVF